MTSPTILIERSFDDRVTRLVEEYAPKWSRRDDRIFSERLMLLKSHIQADVLSEINLSVQRREFHTAVSLLLTHRYDRAYDKSIVKQKDQIKATFHWGSDTSEIEKFIQTHSATF